MVGLEGQRGVERRRPGARRSGPGRRTGGRARSRRIPASRASSDGRDDVGRPVPPPQPPQERPSSNDWAPSDTRLIPATNERPSVTALVRPRVGLDRDLGAVREPEPRPDPFDQRGDATMTAAGSACRRRCTGCRVAAAPRTRHRPASARSPISVRSAPGRRPPAPPVPARRRPRVHDEVAVRAQRDAERDVDVERDRRPRGDGRGRRAWSGRRYWSRVASPDPSTCQPLGRSWRRATSSTSVPRAFGSPAWPVVRKIATRVIA